MGVNRIFFTINESRMMLNTNGIKNISRKTDKNLIPFEEFLSQAFFALEIHNHELDCDLKGLFITSVKEINVLKIRKAILIQVPYCQLIKFQSIHKCLIVKLENVCSKTTYKDVLFVANHHFISKLNSGMIHQKPRSRILTYVHEAILDQIIYPYCII